MCPNYVHVLPPRIMRDPARPMMGDSIPYLFRGEANPNFETTRQLASLTRQLELLRASRRQPQAYNSGWQAPFYSAPQQCPTQQFPTQSNQPPRPSLEDILQSFVQATEKRFQSVEASVKSVEASVKRIETQVGQIAESVGELINQMEPGELPSHAEQDKGIDNKVIEAASSTINQTKDIPSSSVVKNCSSIDSIDLLAEKLFIEGPNWESSMILTQSENL